MRWVAVIQVYVILDDITRIQHGRRICLKYYALGQRVQGWIDR